MRTSSHNNYDTNVSLKYLALTDRFETQPVKSSGSHPALLQLARTLGKQAGRYFVENRFKGLGQIELIRLQMEAAQSRRTGNDAV